MSEKKKVVVLGAGIAGLSAGYFLSRSGQYDVTVLESAPVVGGMCASFEYKGFILDYGPHKLYSIIPGVLDEIVELMGDRLLKLSKRNRIYLQGHLLDYPLKLTNLIGVLGLWGFFKLGLGYAWAFFRSLFDRREPQSYEEFMLKLFGRPAYELIFQPLAEKVWGDPASLHVDMARTRVPSANGLEVVLKLLGIKKETAATNAEFFYYPVRGFGDWPQKLKEEIDIKGGKVLTGCQVLELEKTGTEITGVKFKAGPEARRIGCDHLISTIPLTILNSLASSNGKTSSQLPAEKLQFRHLILVYVTVDRPLVLKDQWIFFPEKEFVFGRVFEQKQMNPDLGPSARTVICCDFTCEENSDLWRSDDAALVVKAVEGLNRAGFIKPQEVKDSLVKRYTNFYPRYDRHYREKISELNTDLKRFDNLLLTGRLGMYNYNNSDHCFDMAQFISERLVRNVPAHKIWDELEARVQSYRIVD